MTSLWSPSTLGRLLSGSPGWRLSRHRDGLLLETGDRRQLIGWNDVASMAVQPGWLWSRLVLRQEGSPDLRLGGLPGPAARRLAEVLREAGAARQLQADVAWLQRCHQDLRAWLARKVSVEDQARRERRWIGHEAQSALEQACPSLDIQAVDRCLDQVEVRARLGAEAADLQQCLLRVEADHRGEWAALNEAHTRRELVLEKTLFDQVERRPLSEEQARAVICFDHRVQVVAAAGSGKTSTMVAKAAYAIRRGLAEPDQIVLLAFNRQAAVELRERARQAFARVGLNGVAVEAATFHALGLKIIGLATGRRPDIPDWAMDAAEGLAKLAVIVDELKDRSPSFRERFDLFRFVYGRDLPAFGLADPDAPRKIGGQLRLPTIDGKWVRSQEEAMIANWLFYNGVDYRYEASYPHVTEDADHRQYQPDFYYPGIDLYHEHFALDRHGQAPAAFEDYAQGVAWKRDLHRRHGSDLIETHSCQLRTEEAFVHLADELVRRGIELDPHPDREIPAGGQPPMEATELLGLMRTFISHAKSNHRSAEDLRGQWQGMREAGQTHRDQVFLELVIPVMEAWDRALAAEGGMDFEDMLNRAAEHLEQGHCQLPYRLVMADEFQDASRSRARLCRAMVEGPGRFFFAVGDDWQSINRFAGADVSVMTGFQAWFGPGEQLRLERTFRCPQPLCDIAGHFVSKNPAQLRKRVRSAAPVAGPVLQAWQVARRQQLGDAVEVWLQQLAEQVRQGQLPPGREGRLQVFVLGRYNSERQYLPTPARRWEDCLDISFQSIHRSKGSEADYVILPEMLSPLKGRGFPSKRSDDPVLGLVMPSGDDYPHGEERRLFYVALTRARRGVVMFSVSGQSSVFLQELVADGAVAVTDIEGRRVVEEACPGCGQGVLVWRKGRFGEFRSCSNYPACTYKPRQPGRAPSSTG